MSLPQAKRESITCKSVTTTGSTAPSLARYQIPNIDLNMTVEAISSHAVSSSVSLLLAMSTAPLGYRPSSDAFKRPNTEDSPGDKRQNNATTGRGYQICDYKWKYGGSAVNRCIGRRYAGSYCPYVRFLLQSACKSILPNED